MSRFKCCICGDVYWGYGNNPYPYDKNSKHRCCDDCNTMFVIPARLTLVNRVIDKERGDTSNAQSERNSTR